MTARIDWSYHRNGCKTCGRTQEYLKQVQIETREQVDARKNRLTADDALALVRKVDVLLVAKGKSVVRIDLTKESPDAESLKKLLLGPTGHLRAPTLRRGKTLIVGFNPEMYREAFGAAP